MRFLALLDTNSAISRRWRGETRMSGLLDGALFRWNDVLHRYEAEELTQEAVDKFRVRQDQAVILETVSVLPNISVEPLVWTAPDAPVPSSRKKPGGHRRVLRE